MSTTWSVRQPGSINTSTQVRDASRVPHYFILSKLTASRHTDFLICWSGPEVSYLLSCQSKTANMSDYEDEMDVDAPAPDTSVTFGGDTKKGKRSAANLPVEAEDSLPW